MRSLLFSLVLLAGMCLGLPSVVTPEWDSGAFNFGEEISCRAQLFPPRWINREDIYKHHECGGTCPSGFLDNCIAVGFNCIFSGCTEQTCT